ncbi:MAG TPA: hypothetical protein VM260_10755 [Pirellula sp.]|nr:hypothetical protein [Pirellula sp.]
MGFELQLGLQRLLLPALCSLIGCVLLSRADQSEDWYDDAPVSRMAFPTFLGAVICGLGMICSDLWQRGIISKPEAWTTWQASYQWQWMVWMIPASMLIMALARSVISVPIHFASLASIVTSSIAIGVLFVCLSEPTVWDDQKAKWLPWMATSFLAVIWNIASLNSIAKSDGSRWVSFTILGQLGCIAAITLQSYASLGEWALVGIGVATGASLVGLFDSSTSKLHYGWQLSTVVLPLGIMAVACLAVSSFFESRPLPLWLIGSVLFLPTLVGVMDFVYGRTANPWFRVFLAMCVCFLVLGGIFFATKPWETEW